MTEDTTFWIALWGAVSGTVATIGGIVGLLRDRARLAAHQEIAYRKAGEDSYAKMVLHVVNNGRQSVTVFQAGFSTSWETERRWLRRQKVARSFLADAEGPEFPLRLEPGEPITITVDLIKKNYAYLPDSPPQGFATDTRKRWTTAEPEISRDVLQEIYGELWPTRRGRDLPGASRGERA